MKPTVIAGPPGTGKSRHAEAARKALGLIRIVDAWDGVTPLKQGDLALTNIEIDTHPEYRVIQYAAAQRLIHAEGHP